MLKCNARIETMTNGLTTNPEDPDLGHGVDSEPVEQNKKYLVLPEDERKKDFIRPVRLSYVHVGIGGHEIDPNNPSKHGRTENACGVKTRMSVAIAETYAVNPKFYGSTYCVGCQKHLPVSEFVWSDDGEVVGS